MQTQEEDCKHCSGKIRRGALFCSTCGRSRLIGIKQWELLGIIIIGVFCLISVAINPSNLVNIILPAKNSPTATGAPIMITKALGISIPTLIKEASATSTPTIIPKESTTSTPTPKVNFSEPEEFLRNYFNAVTHQRNYEYTWTLMTDDFIERNTPSGYSEYVNFWNSVDRVDLKSIELYEREETSVKCRIKMVMIINGKNYPIDADYHLIYNSNNNTWMFD